MQLRQSGVTPQSRTYWLSPPAALQLSRHGKALDSLTVSWEIGSTLSEMLPRDKSERLDVERRPVSLQ